MVTPRRTILISGCLAIVAGILPLPGASSAGSPSHPKDIVLDAVADASVSLADRRTNFGRDPLLEVGGTPSVRAYVRFDLPADGILGSASLRLFSLSRARAGFTVAATEGPWGEKSITSRNAPQPGDPISSSGPLRRGWVEVDVTDAVAVGTSLSLVLTSPSRRPLTFASREAGRNHRPSQAPGGSGKGKGKGPKLEVTIEPAPSPSPSPSPPAVPPSPSPSPSPSPLPEDCSGIPLAPSQNVATAASSYPAGTVFCITSGVHSLPSKIVPKNGQQFIGLPGAVLRGTKQDPCFGGSGADVVVRGLVIENCGTSFQQGGGVDVTGPRWLIQGNEVRSNGGIGIRVRGSETRVMNNYVHHNEQTGLGAGGGSDIVFEGNEVAYNNTMGYDWKGAGGEAGGSKFSRTMRLTVRANHVHHNAGPGLWTDIDNMDTLIEDNVVTDNAGGGIIHEISYDAVIRNNVVARNYPGGTWLDGAGISVESSPNVEVYGNTLELNGDGLAVVQRDRSPGIYGEHISRNVFFHDNVIKMCEGHSGAVQNVGDTALFTSRNIRFENNHYLVGTSKTRWWQWQDSPRTWSEWRGYGLDLGGSIQIIC